MLHVYSYGSSFLSEKSVFALSTCTFKVETDSHWIMLLSDVIIWPRVLT